MLSVPGDPTMLAPFQKKRNPIQDEVRDIHTSKATFHTQCPLSSMLIVVDPFRSVTHGVRVMQNTRLLPPRT